MKNFCLLFLSLLLSLELFGQTESKTVTLALCNDQNICVKGQKKVTVCFKGQIPKNHCGITGFDIIWDINRPSDVYSEKRVIPATRDEPVFFDIPPHEYDVESFANSSDYEKIIVVRIIAYNDASCNPDPDRGLNEFTFINSPIARFALTSNKVCLGSSTNVTFNNLSTPREGSTYEWDYGDGSPKGATASHAYNQKGSYTITLTAKNKCDVSTYSQTLEVLDPPQPMVKDSAIVVSGNENLICLSGGGIVRLDGRVSSNDPNEYDWDIRGPNVQYIENTQRSSPNPKLQFISEGTYTIRLRVKNACNVWSDWKTITYKVVKDKVITLKDFSSCKPVTVKIDNPEPDVTYYLDGTVLPAEGKFLDLSDEEHTLSATSTSGCGTAGSRKFYVKGIKPVSINPLSQSTLCLNSSKVEIMVSDPSGGGKWENETLVKKEGEKYFFYPDKAGTFKLTFKNGGADCPVSASIDVTVVQEPILKIPARADTCKAFTYRIDNPVPGAVYTINDAPLPPEGKLLEIAPTPYIVKATLVTSCGSTLKDEISFKIREFKPVKITNDIPAVVCLNSPDILLSVSDPDGVGTWQPDPIIKKSGNDNYFTPTATGKYTILYSGGKGVCEVKDEKIVNVEGVSGFAKDISVCQGTQSVVLEGEPAGGVWKIAGNSVECASSSCINGNTVDLTKILTENTLKFTYESEADNGCPASYNATLTIGNPQSVFTIDNSICVGQKPVIQNDSKNASIFEWHVNGVLKSTAAQPQFDLSPGKSVIQLIAGEGVCKTVSEKTITVNTPADPIDFSLTQDRDCSPVAVAFNVTGNNRSDVSYLWDMGDGTTFSGFQPPDKSYINQGVDTKKITITVKANTGCGNPQGKTLDLNVKPEPKAAIGADSTIARCSPATILFTNRSTGADGIAEWDFGDGTPKRTTSGIENTIKHEFVVDGTEEKTFYVKIKVQNACDTNTDSIKVVVSPKSIAAFFTITPSENVCVGSVVTFKDASTPIPNQILWAFKDGNTLIDSTSGALVTHKFYEPNKVYEVIMTSKTACNSYDTRRSQIKTYSTINVKMGVSSKVICEGEEVKIQNLSGAGNVKAFYWDFGDGTPVDSTNFNTTHKFEKTGAIKISLAVRDLNGCLATKDTSIFVRSKPKAQMVNDSNLICSVNSFVLRSSTENMSSWTWYVDGTRYTDGSPNSPAITLTRKEGFFDVILVVSDGTCKDSTLFPSAIHAQPCEVFYPDAFTPDGSVGKYWTIFGKGIENVELSIFNRWGEVIYYSNELIQNDQSKGWDGTYKGQKMPSGSYPYQAKIVLLDGREDKKKGFIKLVRDN